MLYYKKTGETSSFCFILCPIPRIIPHYSHKKQRKRPNFQKILIFPLYIQNLTLPLRRN